MIRLPACGRNRLIERAARVDTRLYCPTGGVLIAGGNGVALQPRYCRRSCTIQTSWAATE